MGGVGCLCLLQAPSYFRQDRVHRCKMSSQRRVLPKGVGVRKWADSLACYPSLKACGRSAADSLRAILLPSGGRWSLTGSVQTSSRVVSRRLCARAVQAPSREVWCDILSRTNSPTLPTTTCQGLPVGSRCWNGYRVFDACLRGLQCRFRRFPYSLGSNSLVGTETSRRLSRW